VECQGKTRNFVIKGEGTLSDAEIEAERRRLANKHV
jgi:hypothetical protein